MLHFEPIPFPSAVLDTSPVLEFATFFGVSPTFVGNVDKFLTQASEPTPEGYYGHAYGEVVEQNVKKHAEQENGTGSNALVLFIGWESKEAHMSFRETEQFKANIGLLREGNEGVEMVSREFFVVLGILVVWDGRVLTLCSFISRRLRRLRICRFCIRTGLPVVMRALAWRR